MPIPKESRPRLPTYAIYYLILSLIIALLILSLFISLPISTNQLFLLFLADAGGYGAVEELTKARADSYIRRYQSALILIFISLIVAVTAVLLLIALDSIVAVILLTAIDLAMWGSLWLVRHIGDKKLEKLENIL
jgi:hypothetical protein